MPIPSHFASKGRFVQVKDRIPFWNIAPNDKVIMVRGAENLKGLEGIVSRVDRVTNTIVLKESEFAVKKRVPNEYPGEALDATHAENPAPIYAPRSFHVSNFRLRVQVDGTVYTAKRVRRTAVSWNRKQNRFSWNRFGLVPTLTTEKETGWFPIPWPTEQVTIGPKGILDVESGLTPRTSSWLPSLESLSLSHGPPSDPSRAPESQVSSLDLQGGYHSRANRTRRFNDAKLLAKTHGKQMKVDAVALRKLARQ